MKLRPIEQAVLECFISQYPVDKNYTELQMMIVTRDEEITIHTMYEDLDAITLVSEIESTVDRYDFLTEEAATKKEKKEDGEQDSQTGS